jgi:hypothetical protein
MSFAQKLMSKQLIFIGDIDSTTTTLNKSLAEQMSVGINV